MQQKSLSFAHHVTYKMVWCLMSHLMNLNLFTVKCVTACGHFAVIKCLKKNDENENEKMVLLI